MEYSEVFTSMKKDNNLDCNYCIIVKGKENVKSRILIVMRKTELVIFDYDNFITNEKFTFNYLLFKQYRDENSTYKDFLKLIGKMCKKDINSKYFLNHKKENNRMIINDNTGDFIMIEKYNYNHDEYDVKMNKFKKFIEQCYDNKVFKVNI